MTAIDSSVAVAALTGWHEAHETSRRAAREALIPAHALLETYAVLTRLPYPRAVPASVAAALLHAWFPAERVLVPPARVTRSLVAKLAAAEVVGGAAYDALIGLTAAAHSQPLLTRDQRALRVYQRLDVDFVLLTN